LRQRPLFPQSDDKAANITTAIPPGLDFCKIKHTQPFKFDFLLFLRKVKQTGPADSQDRYVQLFCISEIPAKSSSSCP
jgi:hypothetical protein